MSKTPPRSPRHMQFCVEMETFPSEDVIAYLGNVEGVKQLRFCSVQDANGALPPPQLLKHNEPWAGKCLVFLSHGSKNGTSLKHWEKIAHSLAMTPRPVDAGKRCMWKVYRDALHSEDPRVSELTHNVVRTGFSKVSRRAVAGVAEQESQACAAAREEAEAAAEAVAEAERECESAAEMAEAAAQSGALTQEAEAELRGITSRALCQLIERQCEQAAAEFFAGQPSRRQYRQAGHSLKSKKPEHVAAAKERAEKRLAKEAAANEKRAAAAERRAARAARELADKERRAAEKAAKRAAEGGGGGSKKKVRFDVPSQEPQAPPLSLAHRVLHRALPQPDSERWKYHLTSFFQRRHIYGHVSKAATRTFCAVLPQAYASSPSLSHKNRTGVGLLLPGPEKVGENCWPSALELHRCAMALEGAAEGLLRACADAITCSPMKAMLLSQEEAADLQAAWRARGGMGGEGAPYWPEQLAAPLFPLEPFAAGARSQLADCIQSLRAGRAAALRRRYLVVDDVTWSLPFLAKVFFLRSASQQATKKEYETHFRRINQFRACAIRADAHGLVAYGSDVLRYADRLVEIARRLGACNPLLAEALELPRQGLLVAETHITNDPPDLDVVRCRLADEEREAKSILRDLGLQSSPLLEASQRLRAAVAEAMQGDSHGKKATRHLHPSPCLPDAEYAPSAYLGAAEAQTPSAYLGAAGAQAPSTAPGV